MTKADFSLPAGTPEHDLAAGFADYTVRWACEQAAPHESQAALRIAATRLSLAVSDGHVCLPLSALADYADADDMRGLLLRSGVIAPATGNDPHAVSATPLVLDDAGRLYLRRYYDWERQLADALTRRGAAETIIDTEAVRAQLARLFPYAAAPDWQCVAVAMALSRQLTVISGGPGTGKTTTAAALLACLFALHDDKDAPLRVALAAPTGKAAARMLEALRKRADTLSPDINARMPAQAYTLHRLLGVTNRPGHFRHNAENPLALDVLIVDEASMLDVALAARLLDALSAHARLILLGDKDQLAAVEAGAVFAELSASPALSPACAAQLASLTGASETALLEAAARHNEAPLRDCVVWLSHSHRFTNDSGIGRLAAGINAGQGEETLAWLRGGNGDTVSWIEDDAAALPQTLFAHIQAGYATYIEAVRAYTDDPAPVFAAFERFRILCAVRDGPRGVAALNAWMTAEMQNRANSLAENADPASDSPWYRGRPVIVLRNDYVFGLFNGDVGICLPDRRGDPLVWFPAAEGAWRILAPSRLPQHDTAFALTVHKSQGSEFGEVLTILPPMPNRVMTRELLYTAVTRAARKVTICGNETVFVAACATPTVRHTGLTARMMERGKT